MPRRHPNLVTVLAFGCAVLMTRAASAAPAAPAATAAPQHADASVQRPSYALTRDDEDWTVVRDPGARTDPFDGLKYVPLSASDANRFLTVGLNAREFYEHYFDQNWDPSAGSNGYVLHRYLLSLDAHVDRVRVYTELESALVTFRTGGPGPNNRDAFDPAAAYVSYALGGTTGAFAPPLALQAGRYELDYGSGRILSANNGPGIRHSFDGVRAIARAGGWRIDALATYGVTENPSALDDATNHAQSLIGAYAQRERSGSAILDAYLLSEHRASQTYQRGAAPETRDTIGGRAGNTWRRVDSELEAAYQFGSFGAIPISAFTVAGSAGYTIPSARAVTRAYISGGIGSGDHGGGVLGTFRPPTFKAAYLGALAANGPENSAAFQAGITVLVDRRITAGLEYSHFVRQSKDDGVYGVAFTLLRRGSPAQPSAIGTSPLVTAGYLFDRHLTLQAFYQRYNAGAFLQSTPAHAGTGYCAAALDFTF